MSRPAKDDAHDLGGLVDDVPLPVLGPAELDLPTVSHELRAPLGGILGLASMLLDTPLDSTQRATVHTIRTGAEHLAAIIDRFLPIDERARQSAGRPVPFDPAVLATTVARLLEPQAAAKGINLTVIGHRSLPNLAGADPVAIRQILVNVASNAIRVTDSGSIAIRVRPERGAQALRFEIADNGPGLTDGLRDALAGSPTTRGIGLALCRALVDESGGTLDAFASPSGGCTVWFSIPYLDVRPTPGSELPRPDRARVLLAEDDDVNAQVSLTLLERLGYRVDLVATGVDALRAWRSTPYELCLLGVNLADLDGFEVTRCIRELERARPLRSAIIGLTPGNLASDRDRCLAAGMDAQLAKPLELRSLLEVIGRFAPPNRVPSAPEQGTGAAGETAAALLARFSGCATADLAAPVSTSRGPVSAR